MNAEFILPSSAVINDESLLLRLGTRSEMIHLSPTQAYKDRIGRHSDFIIKLIMADQLQLEVVTPERRVLSEPVTR